MVFPLVSLIFKFKTTPLLQSVVIPKVLNVATNPSSFLGRIIMTNNNEEQMNRLEKNAQLAESIIADIYAKLSEVQKSGSGTLIGGETPELIRLRQENESLRLEVAKWKELLLLREIRNGGNPIVRNVEEVGKAAVDVKKCASEAVAVKGKGSGGSVTTANNKSGGKGKGSHSLAALSSVSAHPHPPNEKTSKSEVNKKGGNKPTASSATTAPGPPTTGDEVDVSKLDFRIGLITQCDPHPDADSLYVEKIDLGEGQPRTVISGLVKHIRIEEMRNRFVVVLTNLKPAKMRGILSEGMVMCASSPDKVEILLPPQGCSPGDVVEVDNFPRAPEAVLNPKKKIWESVAPHLKTNEKKEATYKGTFLWRVDGKGVIRTATLANTMIK